jgi:hypothetical protein
MKTITQITGGKQGLFERFHEIQKFFEEHLAENIKTLCSYRRSSKVFRPSLYIRIEG